MYGIIGLSIGIKMFTKTSKEECTESQNLVWDIY